MIAVHDAGGISSITSWMVASSKNTREPSSVANRRGSLHAREQSQSCDAIRDFGATEIAQSEQAGKLALHIGVVERLRR